MNGAVVATSVSGCAAMGGVALLADFHHGPVIAALSILITACTHVGYLLGRTEGKP